MKVRLKVLLSIFCIVILYAFYYWGLPAILDLGHKVPLIQKFVKKEFGVDLELKQPKLKMGLTPSIWLEADYFGFKDKNSKPLYVKHPKIKVDLIPLLIGKIHLTYLSCDELFADLKVDKNYRFYIGNYLIMRSSNPKFSIENSKMNIENYEVILKDEIQNKTILAKGDYFNLEEYNSKKSVKFSINSKLKVKDWYSIINTEVNFKLPFKKGFDTNEILFDGMITNLNLADFSPYIKRASKGEIVKTEGILNVKADTIAINRRTKRLNTQMVVENLKVARKNPQFSVYFKGKLKINTIIDVSKNILKIKDFKMLSNRTNVNVKGKINNISSNNPNLDLSVLVNKSRIEDFISLIPLIENKNSEINFTALKKYGYYSDLEGELFIKGKSDNPKLTGNFLSTNGYIIKPLNIPKATVKVKFLGDRIYLDINVPVSQNESVIVKGIQGLYANNDVILDISSTQNIDLETTEFILLPVHEIFNFDLGPLPEMKLQGQGNIKLKTSGSRFKPHLVGAFNFKNTTASFNYIKSVVKNCEGSLVFKDDDTYFVTKNAVLDGKPIKIEGKCSLAGVLDFNISTNNQKLPFLLRILNTSPMLVDLKEAFSPIKNTSGEINLAVNLKGKVKNINDFKLNKTVILAGNIKLLGNNILLSDLNIPLKNLSGVIKFKDKDADFDLYSFVEKSKILIKGRIKNNKLYSKIKLDDIAFAYFNIPAKIFSGSLEINDDKLTLYKINAALDLMPILIDGYATDIFKNPKFNVYINSKPTQRFIEKYINKNAIYPLKVKGDIIYSARIIGTKDSLHTLAEASLGEDSSIYYMGATLGDTSSPIRIFLDTNVAKNVVKINNFQYDKLISSQNGRDFISTQLNAKGLIKVNKNDIVLNGFTVRTQNPTDAKIFNMLFKKPLIKQGLFSSNILINGSISSPKMLGTLNFTGVDIPLLDTTVKDISLDFIPNNIDIKAKGEIFSNKIVVFSDMENRLIPPYVLSNLDIYLGNLDVNEIAKRISKFEIKNNMKGLEEPKQDVDITNLVIKNAKLKADSVFVKNIFAKNLTADFSLNENLLFSLDNFKFDIAEGSVNGDFKYNFLNAKTSLDISADKVNANSIADTLFDLPNQIYGSLTGQVDLTCNGKNHKTCMDTLGGSGGFRVIDGRMPKLGSMEYLLKAANLVKSGITGITINSLVELVTPLKTGEFENINGNFYIDSGIANSIQIFSKGKDLSLFLTGTYNFSTLVADMEVFGRISKKISNALGPVGNTSLNTLFNTIPGLNLDENNKAEFIKNFNKIPGFELNDKTFRIFSAEIYGDINGDNYVQSFKWVE